mmetsp:Transcript_22869/g.58303  ORF Transcript_22869/g.58303 Transcript_22869/m.58303 type:complete len:241 (-) Transcript_22869:698-1420(-)
MPTSWCTDGPCPDTTILSRCASSALTPVVAVPPTAATPREMRGLYSSFWLRYLSTCTAHTLVSTSASTTGTPPAMAADWRATGCAMPGGGRRNCSDSESATSVMRSACSTSARSASTEGCPPRMATTSAPDVVRTSQRRALQPRGRFAGVLVQGEELSSVRPRISMTSSARSASPRKLSLEPSMSAVPPVSSSRSSARGASRRMSAHPGTAVARLAEGSRPGMTGVGMDALSGSTALRGE